MSKYKNNYNERLTHREKKSSLEDAILAKVSRDGSIAPGLNNSSLREEYMKKYNAAKDAFEEGKQLYKQGDNDSAIDAFTRSINFYESPSAYDMRGNVYSKKGEYEKAAADHTQAILIKDYDNKYIPSGSYHNRGMAYLNMNQCDKAIADLKKAVSLAPDADYIKMNLVRAQEAKTNQKNIVKRNRIAAMQGDAGAQNSLGYYYTQGQGVPLDEKKAAYWFRKAAEQGHAVGMSNLGECYRDGYGGIKQDFAKAEELFNKAIAAGDANAQIELDKLKKMQGVA